MFDFFKKTASETRTGTKVPGFLLAPHPLRGFTNLGIYEVHGLNSKTGRKNKRVIEALDENHALKIASESCSLLEPFEISEIQRPMATERQIAYGKSLKISITPEMSMIDASAMICRHQDGDPASDSITKQEFDKASFLGITVSSLCGHTYYRSALKK